jgi:hypothetical protein
MLVTFSSKVDADVIMMADHAKLLFRVTGKEVGNAISERGVFTAEQLGDAIKKLEHAISAEQRPPEPDELDQQQAAREVVFLGQRAYPLLSMMRKAQQAGASVMWETSSGW